MIWNTDTVRLDPLSDDLTTGEVKAKMMRGWGEKKLTPFFRFPRSFPEHVFSTSIEKRSKKIEEFSSTLHKHVGNTR